MEMIRIYKTCLIILVLVLVNSCSLFKSMPKLDSKVDLINAIMKNPEYAEYYIKNSKFYSKEYSKCVISEKSIFKYYYMRTIDTIQQYTNRNYKIDVDTLVEEYDFDGEIMIFNRFHIFYDSTYLGIEFDFIKVDNVDYLYEIRYILNKRRIIQESGSKIELLKKIIENPDRYEDIIKNSSFYHNDSTTLGSFEFRDIIIDHNKKLKKENNYRIKHVIRYSNISLNTEYYTHLILVISKSDRNIYNYLKFKYINNEWKITTEGTNAEYIWGHLGEDDDNY
ncbi:hypothetical protein MASR1M45_04840 [Candidatus Kapaibacterium sp.]